MSASEPSAPPERHIRVFVSSTFRDMAAERDHMVKFIFPELRKLCESRGVTWGEVDLRWGVTEEEAAEGKVLPICLEEIKRCRPYFIGILGERYGWVPEAISSDLIKREPWLEKYADRHKSVTELEILHGVLEDPEMANHAFFYFRDPAYLENLPPDAKRKDFISEDSESAEKLHDLKRRIKDSRFPVREDYANPGALGKFVLADLKGVIDKLWPEGSQLDPLDREAMDHEAFAQSRACVYIGRQEYFERLDAHACGSGEQPLVIVGDSGSGKSALLANWALKHRSAHAGALVLQHYIGGTPYSSEWAAMLRRIMGELKRGFGIAQEIPDQPDALRSAFPNWLHMAAAKGRVILILDALNQLEDRDGAPDLVWLPHIMPPNVRFIVSTLPGRALDEISKRRWPVLKVEPLNAAERGEFVERYLKQYTKSLNDARTTRITDAPQCANPLYLRVLLEELRLFGEHARLDERIGHYLEAPTIPALFERVLARWEQDYGGKTHLVSESMTLLWAARRGLSEAELLDALGKANEKGEHEPLPRAQWSPLFLAAVDSLVSRGGLLTFFHDFLREAVKNTYLKAPDRQQAAHEKLAEYFRSKILNPLGREDWSLENRVLAAVLSSKEIFNLRTLVELPWQLMKAGAWPRLYALLSESFYFAKLWETSDVDAKQYWAQLERNGFSMIQAYGPLLDAPDQVSSYPLGAIARLLAHAGHGAEALSLQTYLSNQFSQSEDPEDLQRLQSSLGNRAAILHDRGDLDEGMELLVRQEQICRQIGDVDGLQRALGGQAHFYYDRGDLDRAMAVSKEQERICLDAANNDGIQASLATQAGIHYSRGDLDEAMRLLKRQEEICRALGESAGLAQSLGNQANFLYERGDLDGAMHLLKQKEEISRELGDKNGLQSAFGKQAVMHLAKGELADAMILLKQQESICRELGRDLDLQLALGNQAEVLRCSGNLEEAMALLKQQEQICTRLGNKNSMGVCLLNQANIYTTMGNPGKAMELYEAAGQMFESLGDKDKLRVALGNKALLLQERGQLDEAISLHKQAENIARQMGSIQGVASALFQQAHTLSFKTGEIWRALALIEEAFALAKSHGLTLLCRQMLPYIEGMQLRARLGEHAETGENDGVPTLRTSTEPTPREKADSDYDEGNWDAAAQNFEKLLSSGASLDGLAPRLITALLNTHAEPPPATVARVQQLISELEEYGHFDLALAARKQLEAKLPKEKKSWWKVW
jgi:tetratricopeptide (TPR) repeat protein